MKKYKFLVVILVTIFCLNLFTSYTVEADNINMINAFETVKNLDNSDSEFDFTEDKILSDSNAQNTMLISETKGSNFIYTSNITINRNTKGQFSLVFRYGQIEDSFYDYEYYTATIDFDKKEAYIDKTVDDKTSKITSIQEVLALSFSQNNEDEEITREIDVKVVAIDRHISLYINDIIVCSTYDYIEEQIIYSDSNYINSGFVGVQTNLTDVVINDLNYTKIDDTNTPYLKDVEFTLNEGEVEENSKFNSSQLVYQYYVSSEANTLKIEASPVSKDTKTIYYYESGDRISDDTIALLNGQNVIYAQCVNGNSTIKYKFNIYKRSTEESYYYEDYRSQYHYTPKNGEISDIAGLVKVEDTYHNFYQYSTVLDGKEISMWSHTTSKDMIKWTEKPIAFYSDEQGNVISSTIVYDEKNTSGFFDEDKNGLVAIMSVDENSGNSLVCAYSKDEGNTWIKTNSNNLQFKIKSGTSISNDTLNNMEDLQVFRYEDKWFMITSGNEVNIFSSDDLLNWVLESSSDIKISNASLFRTEVVNTFDNESNNIDEENGEENNQEIDTEYKWVLIGDNNIYKIGEFSNENSEYIYSFIPDESYSDSNGNMNIASDVDYSKIYYTGEYNDENLSVNSMSIIECLSDIENFSENYMSKFNGTTSLVTDIKVIENKNGDYKLSQTPINGYEEYYNKEEIFTFNGEVSDRDSNILGNLEYSSYIIDATITPNGSSVAGFNILMGENEKTTINYYSVTKEFTIDRSKSGEIKTNTEKIITESLRDIVNEDGSFDVKIYVDNSTIEIYLDDNTLVCSFNVYPEIESDKMEFYSIGGDTLIDVTVTPINTIWDKVAIEEPEKPTEKITDKPTQEPTNVSNILAEADIVWIIIIVLGVALLVVGLNAVVKSLKAKKRANRDKEEK